MKSHKKFFKANNLRLFMLNKRGQGLSTNAIILIVLGVFVLAIMIFGFTLGWSKVAPWLSSENVDDVVKSCENSCITRSVFGFCSKVMELDDGVVTVPISGTCFILAANAEYAKYGIKSCEGLCPVQAPTQ